MSQTTLYDTAKEFVERAGVTAAEKYADYIFRIAIALGDIHDTRKGEKILIELEYNAAVMDDLEGIIRDHFGLKTSVPSFKSFWKNLRNLLVKLQMQDVETFEIVIEAIRERKAILPKNPVGNIFENLLVSMQHENLYLLEFLKKIYELNHQIGSLPSGKGEHIHTLFFENCEKASDIRVFGKEIEIKTLGSRFGDSPGSPSEFKQRMQEYFSSVSENFDFEKFSLGHRAFRNTWFPIFRDFTLKYPEMAENFMWYHAHFYVKRLWYSHNSVEPRIKKFVENPTLEHLEDFYDWISIELLKDSMKDKEMIVFENFSTGNYRKITYEQASEMVSFAGCSRNTPLKIVLPKGSATMRPEIVSNKKYIPQIISSSKFC